MRVYMCVCACMRVYMCVCACMRVYMCVCVYVCRCTYVWVCTCGAWVRAWVRECMHACVLVHVYDFILETIAQLGLESNRLSKYVLVVKGQSFKNHDLFPLCYDSLGQLGIYTH